MIRIIKIVFIAIIFTSCSECPLKERVSRLEGRVTELENIIRDRGNALTPDPVGVNADVEKPTGPVAQFEWEDQDGKFDFGTINEGDVVTHTFSFKNSGTVPLVISSATGSCGCTIPTYPKEPIAPGEEGKIVVRFNSKGKPGVQNKNITIVSNTYPTINILEIKAMVTPKNKK
ncbi:MAG: DUF1573 domain-containing protein [Chitinophagaceae bacterium]|nr:DUF1573 domain-containing protein [Chitinophagaceae bacterium]